MSSRRPEKKKSSKDRPVSQWSEWKWTNEYGCEYRTRIDSHGKEKFEYRNKTSSNISATVIQSESPDSDCRGRRANQDVRPPHRGHSTDPTPRDPSIGPRPRSPDPPPRPPPKSSSSSQPSLNAFDSSHLPVMGTYPLVSPYSDSGYNTTGPQTYGARGQTEPKESSQDVQIIIKERAAKFSYGTQEHSFISESFANTLGLTKQAAKKATYFERPSQEQRKNDKDVKVIERVKVAVTYAGKLIADARFYVVPQKERFDGDIVVGTDLASQYPYESYSQTVSSTPPQISLPIRDSLSSSYGTVQYGYGTSTPLLSSTSPFAALNSVSPQPTVSYSHNYTLGNNERSNLYDYSQQATQPESSRSTAPRSESRPPLDRDENYETPGYNDTETSRALPNIYGSLHPTTWEEQTQGFPQAHEPYS